MRNAAPTATTRKPNMAAARRALAAANVHHVIVAGDLISSDSHVGPEKQAANLDAALAALDNAGINYERDADYPTWLAQLV